MPSPTSTEYSTVWYLHERRSVAKIPPLVGPCVIRIDRYGVELVTKERKVRSVADNSLKHKHKIHSPKPTVIRE